MKHHQQDILALWHESASIMLGFKEVKTIATYQQFILISSNSFIGIDMFMHWKKCISSQIYLENQE